MATVFFGADNKLGFALQVRLLLVRKNQPFFVIITRLGFYIVKYCIAKIDNRCKLLQVAEEWCKRHHNIEFPVCKAASFNQFFVAQF